MTPTAPTLDQTKFDGSEFDDDVWTFRRAARSKPSRRSIDWTVLQDVPPELTQEIKVAFALLANGKEAGGHNLSGNTLTSQLSNLRELAKWMTEQGLLSLGDLNNDYVLEYLEAQYKLGAPTFRTKSDAVGETIERDRTPRRQNDKSWYATNNELLNRLRQASPAMVRCGFPGVAFTIPLLSRKQILQRPGDAGYKPISRKAWIAIMHSAYVFVHRCMPDIVRLIETVEEAKQPSGEGGGTSHPAKRRSSGIALRDATFRFSDDNPFCGEWQSKYDSFVADYGKSGNDAKTNSIGVARYNSLRDFLLQLHRLALGATAISIIGMTGMRMSEFLGLQVFQVGDDGTARYPTLAPHCVAVDLNKGDVNYEFIVLRGRVFKHQNEATGLETDWVAGYRLRGGEYQSVAALAARRYMEVSATLRQTVIARDLYAASHLAVTAGLGGVGTWASHATTNKAIRTFVRELAQEHVSEFNVADFDPESVHAHRFRSTLANMLLYENEDLLDDIRLQLKHYHHDITYRAYVQNDLDALGITQDATTRVYVGAIRDYIAGLHALGGGTSNVLRAGAEEVARGDPTVPESQRIQEFAESLARTAVTRRDYGLCDFKPLQAKCLSGIPDLNRVAVPLPDENFAEERLCITCPNLLILPEYLPHLQRRLTHLQSSARIAEAIGDRAQAEIHQMHADSIQRQLDAVTKRTETVNDEAIQKLQESYDDEQQRSRDDR